MFINDQPTTLRLTDSAAARIKHILQGEKTPGAMVRLEVLGGGCSGYQYKFGFSTDRTADDVVIEHDGAELLVDTTSLDLLKGSRVDYRESLMEAGFKVENPNATSSCGCGSSFAV